MRWPRTSVPADVVQGWIDAGHWDDQTLGDLVTEHAGANATQTVAVHSLERPSRGTYGEVEQEARRLAAGLTARGISRGDAVACQLPNWREAITTMWAASLLGAVMVPIVHFYGRREVDYILERTGVRALVTPARFGRLNYLSDAASRPALRDVDVLAVVGDADHGLPDGAVAYQDLLAPQPFVDRADVDPDSPALVAYTSGTTSEPKGVVHTHRTLGAEIRQVSALVPVDLPRLTTSPVGHIGGMLTGVFAPLLRGTPINLLDMWDTERVLQLMTELGVAAGSGATFFLTSLLDAPGLTPRHLELMRHIMLGGAPVPAAVARRADALGLSLTRNYGSTEHPTITGSRHGDPADARLLTDGRPLAGVELRIVNDEGADVAPGEPGEILSRGPDCFVGYTDPALTERYLDTEGWYHTEDIGVLDTHGYLTITDRKKDVIIRGGENISASEVEEVLARMPEVAEVAVIAAPDERFGEHVCAVVRLREPGLLLDTVRAATAEAGLGRQKWPEELHVVEEFPRTPSGKIRKRDLREQLRAQAPSREGNRT